jgi:hypothetical protein
MIAVEVLRCKPVADQAMVELAINHKHSWLTKLFDLKFGKGFSSVKVIADYTSMLQP